MTDRNGVNRKALTGCLRAAGSVHDSPTWSCAGAHNPPLQRTGFAVLTPAAQRER